VINYSLTASDVFFVIIASKKDVWGEKNYFASNIYFCVLYKFWPKLFLVQEEFSEISS